MYLTIVRTPYDPEAEDAGHLRVSHLPLPRPRVLKGGTEKNERIKRETYTGFVRGELIDDYCLPASYEQAIVDWLCRADPGDNLNLPSFGGCDGAVLVLHDEGEPTNYSLRTEPSFVLGNENDDEDAEDEEDDSDEGENRTFLDEDEEEEEERPRSRPTKSKPPKKKPK